MELLQNLYPNLDHKLFQLAKKQREKKFGLQIPDDFKEKARQMRFLSGRGFDGDSIRQSLAN